MHTLGEERENPPNIILGHEFAGIVVEAGTTSLEQRIGERVVISPYKACGICRFCRTGRYNLCISTTHLGHGAGWGEREYYPGGMADYCQVWADKCYCLPEEIAYEEATLIDIMGIAVHAMHVSQMSPGGDVAIIGSGPLGLSIAQMARVWGAKKVFCSDIAIKPLEIALQVGADEAINIKREDLVKLTMQKTGNSGVDAVFDTVGSTQTQQQALKILAPSGTLVNMATNAQKISFSLLELGRERVIRSSSNYFFPEFQMALDLLVAGKVDVKPMITHRFSLSEAPEAFEILLNKGTNECIKAVIIL